MKRFSFYLSCMALVAFITLSCEHEAVEQNIDADLSAQIENTRSPNGCTNIQSGNLVDSEGNPLVVGYDVWGYNYQAQKFNGFYCDAYRNAAWCQPYVDVSLGMKWNDSWLSNKDCDGDGLLDRHYGYDTYRGSGAWLTNHQSGSYDDGEGAICEWDYFVKIVAAPSDAYQDNGNWVAADGTVMGPIIWGDFAIIQEVENDPCNGIEGLQFNSPDHSGLNGW